MRIEELHLKNFRCFKELDIKFPASNLAVFIGLNGSGKTAILDAISMLLAKFPENIVPRLSSLDNISHREFTIEVNKNTLDDISIGSSETTSTINFSYEKKNISWISNYPSKNDAKYPKQHEYCDIAIENSINISQNEVLEIFKTFICIYYGATKKEIYTIDWTGSSNTDFSNFEEWFEKEENIENEKQRNERNFNITNPKLDVIRKSIVTFFSHISEANFSDLKIRRVFDNDEKIGTYEEEIKKHNSFLVIKHNEKELKVSQLSEGQRLLLKIVADITYKLIILSKHNSIITENYYSILEINGVVLIDEIELHLHPQWQREVLPALQKTFPNIQFIVTTHSPQVLSRVDKDNIFILKDNEIYQPSSNPIGRDANDILYEVMEMTKRPKEIQLLSDTYFSLINKNLFEEAQEVRKQLLEKLDKKDPIFIKADAMITRKQLLRK